MTIYTIRPGKFPGFDVIGHPRGRYLSFMDVPGGVPVGARYNTLPAAVKAALREYFDGTRKLSEEQRGAVSQDWPHSSPGVDVTVVERKNDRKVVGGAGNAAPP